MLGKKYAKKISKTKKSSSIKPVKNKKSKSKKNYNNEGKEFEAKFKQQWLETFPDSICERIPDRVPDGEHFYANSDNVSDFYCYTNKNFYFIECKTHLGASIPFSAMPQIDRMKDYLGKPGVKCGFVIWLRDKDLVMYVPVSTVLKLQEDGIKSVGTKAIQLGYNIKVIPSTKMIKYMKSDYTILKDLKDGE